MSATQPAPPDFTWQFSDLNALLPHNNWEWLSQEIPDGKLPLTNQDGAYQNAREIYLNAYNPPLPFCIIGGAALRIWNKEMSPNDKKNVKDLHTNMLICSSEPGRVGTLLHEPEWFLFLNDAWLLASIRKKQVFYLYEPDGSPPRDDSLWSEGRPSVLGRELLMLIIAGYRFLQLPVELRKIVGFVLAPPENPLPMSLTIWALRKSIAHCKMDDVRLIFTSPHFTRNYDSYETSCVFQTDSAQRRASDPGAADPERSAATAEEACATTTPAAGSLETGATTGADFACAAYPSQHFS